MHRCQYIVGAEGNGPDEPNTVIYCDEPASIKHDGCWLCADHYDMVVEGRCNWTAQKDMMWVSANFAKGGID